MAEQATRRQRNDEMTQSERTEGGNRQSQGMERYRQGRYLPSVFSVSPGEFFTLSPVSLLRRLSEDIDRAFSGMHSAGFSEQDLTWAPAVEVQQSGNNLVIRADLPGMNENDIRLEATEEGLVIQGERKREEEHEEGGVYRSERVYGRFHRLIPLPENAKIDQAKAKFRNGVLEVTIPASESQQNRRQIPISTSGEQSSMQGQLSRTAVSGSSR